MAKLNGDEGEREKLYTIKQGNTEADIALLGARLNALRVGGTDIVLGFNSSKDYIESGCYAGATVGRVANRIAGGKFKLFGKSYALEKNDCGIHLHGGREGFDKKLFKLLNKTENSVTLFYESRDGEEGYPGNLKFTVKYTIADGALEIKFEGVGDKDTLWCPTNHAYFNLDGEQTCDCLGNILQINANYYTPTDENMLPSGEKKEASGTPFDFTKPKKIGENFGCAQLESTCGYDHNYILNGECAAHIKSTKTGIGADIYTDYPCLQFYTGGQLGGAKGKTRAYDKWAGFCLEPQYCPNAVNMTGFEKPVLKENEVKSHYIKIVIKN